MLGLGSEVMLALSFTDLKKGGQAQLCCLFCQRASADEIRTHAINLAFRLFRVAVEQEICNEESEHCVAQKLKPLIVHQPDVEAGVFQCLGEKFRVAECVPGGSLKRILIGRHYLNIDLSGFSGLRPIQLGVGRWNFNFPTGASPTPFFQFQPSFPLPSKTKKKSRANKIFVLDTNILLHDPQCLQSLRIILWPYRLKYWKLDRKKSAPGELGYAARKVHRDLRRLFDEENLSKPVELQGQSRSTLGRDLRGGGRLIVVINDYLVNEDFGQRGHEIIEGHVG